MKPGKGTRKVAVKSSPSVVIAFMSKHHDFLPSIPNYGGYSIQEDIDRVRVALQHDPKRLKLYSDMAKKQRIPAISESVLVTMLQESKQKKYRERGSPPFSANKLCGATLKGNDAAMYTSVKNKSGVCTWV
jgi:hypothetical protein